MDRDHRLEFEDVLRAVVRPDAEVGVVLEGQDGEIADGILRFLRDGVLVGLARVGDGLVVVVWLVESALGSGAACWACAAADASRQAATRAASLSFPLSAIAFILVMPHPAYAP